MSRGSRAEGSRGGSRNGHSFTGHTDVTLTADTCPRRTVKWHGQDRANPPEPPVKRHRGEPGHTRGTAQYRAFQYLSRLLYPYPSDIYYRCPIYGAQFFTPESPSSPPFAKSSHLRGERLRCPTSCAAERAPSLFVLNVRRCDRCTRTPHRPRTRNRSSPLRCFPPWCPARALLHLQREHTCVSRISLMTEGCFRSRAPPTNLPPSCPLPRA